MAVNSMANHETWIFKSIVPYRFYRRNFRDNVRRNQEDQKTNYYGQQI